MKSNGIIVLNLLFVGNYLVSADQTTAQAPLELNVTLKKQPEEPVNWKNTALKSGLENAAQTVIASNAASGCLKEAAIQGVMHGVVLGTGAAVGGPIGAAIASQGPQLTNIIYDKISGNEEKNRVIKQAAFNAHLEELKEKKDREGRMEFLSTVTADLKNEEVQLGKKEFNLKIDMHNKNMNQQDKLFNDEWNNRAQLIGQWSTQVIAAGIGVYNHRWEQIERLHADEMAMRKAELEEAQNRRFAEERAFEFAQEREKERNKNACTLM